jgi:hypothetical protein
MNVLIVGGSKGIGAELVHDLDSHKIGGWFTYFTSKNRAYKLQELCPRWQTFQLDLSRDNPQIGTLVSKPSVVVFTSAAGLEEDKNSRYAYSVNSSGPSRLLMALDKASLTPKSVIFVTSYEAHHFGEFDEFESYALVAESKKYGELFCRETCTSRLRTSARFITVASELVIGSTAHTILSLRDPNSVRSVTDKRREVQMSEITSRLSNIVRTELEGSHQDEVIEIVGNYNGIS